MLMFNKPCKSLQISVVAKQPCQGKARLIPRLWLGKINTKLLWTATFPCGGKKTITQQPARARVMNSCGTAYTSPNKDACVHWLGRGLKVAKGERVVPSGSLDSLQSGPDV